MSAISSERIKNDYKTNTKKQVSVVQNATKLTITKKTDEEQLNDCLCLIFGSKNFTNEFILEQMRKK